MFENPYKKQPFLAPSNVVQGDFGGGGGDEKSEETTDSEPSQKQSRYLSD
jgi:hypothetical protein